MLLTPTAFSPLTVGLALTLAGVVVLLLVACYRWDVRKRPTGADHWLIPVALSGLVFQPLHRWYPGVDVSHLGMQLGLETFQALTVAACAGLALLLLGVARRRHPDTEVGFATLYKVQGAPRLDAARATGGGLLVVLTAGLVATYTLDVVARLLPGAIVVPSPRSSAELALVAAFALLVPVGLWWMRVRVSIRPLLAASVAIFPFAWRLVIAAVSLQVALPGALPTAFLSDRHDNIGLAQHAIRFWGLTPQHLVVGGARARAPEEPACDLEGPLLLNDGLHVFTFSKEKRTSTPLTREADGWWLGEHGPLTEAALTSALQAVPDGPLQFSPSRHATLQGLVDVCTLDADHPCALGSDDSRCRL